MNGCFYVSNIRYHNTAFERLIVRKQKAIRKEVRIEARDTARDLANWLTIAVREWTHKPRFAGRVTIQPDFIEVKVDVAGSAKKIFQYVDQGTGTWGPKKAPYPIRPKTPGGMLAFQTGYSARTAVGAKINVGTGEKFGTFVTTPEVMHPGIQPRGFTKKVLEELNPDFVTRMSEAIGRGVAA